jgi:hypothetical protein
MDGAGPAEAVLGHDDLNGCQGVIPQHGHHMGGGRLALGPAVRVGLGFRHESRRIVSQPRRTGQQLQRPGLIHPRRLIKHLLQFVGATLKGVNVAAAAEHLAQSADGDGTTGDGIELLLLGITGQLDGINSTAQGLPEARVIH